MVIENLPSLRIHRLSEAQYNKLVDNEMVDSQALYLVPDDEDLNIDLVETLDNTVTHEQIPSAQATVEYVAQEIAAKAPEIMTDLSTDLSDKKIPSAKATVAYVDAEIAALIGGEKYKEPLDTIKEIASAIENNSGTLEILNAAITQKVDKTEFSEAMAGKLDISTYNTEISSLQNALNTKANSDDLTTLDQKITTTNQNLTTLGNQKADTTYVDEQMATKATKEEVNNKVNQATFDTSISTINQALNNQISKNEQVDGSITALDNEIEATNKEVAKKIDSSKITTALSIGSTTDQVPSAKTVFDYVNTSIVPNIVINPDIWTLNDGWHYISSGFFAKKEHYIELASEALVFIYSNNHQAEYCNYYGWERQGNTFTGSVTLASGGTEGTFTLRTFTTVTVDGDVTYDFPTSKAVADLIDQQIEYNAPDWTAAEGSPGYIKNKPFTTSDPDTGEEVVKIESQYVETVTKVEDTIAQANEIPTVSAVQELIQQAIDESLYIDEEDYV